LNDLFQAADDARRRQGDVDLHRQSLTVEVIQYVEHPEAASISQLVVHEIHRPCLVDRLRRRQRLRHFPDDALARFDAQIQLQIALDPIHALVLPSEALHVA